MITKQIEPQDLVKILRLQHTVNRRAIELEGKEYQRGELAIVNIKANRNAKTGCWDVAFQVEPAAEHVAEEGKQDCVACEGSGEYGGPCEECDSNGWVPDPKDGGTKTCDACEGYSGEPCEVCEGSGQVTKYTWPAWDWEAVR